MKGKTDSAEKNETSPKSNVGLAKSPELRMKISVEPVCIKSHRSPNGSGYPNDSIDALSVSLSQAFPAEMQSCCHHCSTRANIEEPDWPLSSAASTKLTAGVTRRKFRHVEHTKVTRGIVGARRKTGSESATTVAESVLCNNKEDHFKMCNIR